ncbi:YfhO family protein [Kitasatospora sp. NPDC085895]|uniref:YfhO family protein n=1 Tax=Kitasatospora sp. NPDC085895 TaxID=3155057 RepID=UPI00344C29AD
MSQETAPTRPAGREPAAPAAGADAARETATAPAAGRSRRGEAGAAALAAVLSMAAFCLAGALRGTYPFGARSRAVNDLGNQFVPFHAHLWDLMHGRGGGDLLFNWNSGYGSPFLGDFVTYLMNPFSWLVGLFPRDAVDFPVFLVTLLSIGLGAAAMTVLLGRLVPGGPWLRALLAVGYGLCAWVLNDGSPDPMWMWGLVSLPAVGLACDWCLRGRRWVLGTLLVALAWAGNFYTGAMATTASCLVLLLRLALAGTPWRERLRTAGRAAGMFTVGVLLAAPAMTVSLKASKASQPAPPATYEGAPGLTDYLAQLLPGGRSDHSVPNVFVGVLALLLVASLPFNRRVRPAERIGWYALLLLVGASFVWEPTILLWHGLAIPNGSPYRASFVLSGMLVMSAWASLARRPDVRALLGGAGLVALLALAGHGQSSVRWSTWIEVGAGGALLLGALLALARWRTRPLVRRSAGAVLVLTVFASAAHTAWAVTEIRDRLPFYQPRTTVSAQSTAAAEALRAADDWPSGRTDPGPHEFANNDPLLLGGQGGSYYSSYLPAVTAGMLQGLGAGWYIQGRHTLSPADPVGRALFGVTTYLDSTGAPGGFAVKHAPAAPLVTVHPTAAPDTRSVWSRQESLLGARVYETPAPEWTAGPRPVRSPGGWRVPATPKGGTWTTFTASCTPGRTAFLYAPWLGGTVMGAGGKYTSWGRQPMTAMPIRELGTVPADGRVTVQLRAAAKADVPELPLGCLDPAALSAALHGLRGATEVTAGGHGLRAELPAGSTGTALISVPAVDGWRCSVDGGPARAPRSVLGMTGVDLGTGGSEVSCDYRPPGLLPGLAASGAAAAVLLGVALLTRLRRRNGRAADGGPVPSV